MLSSIIEVNNPSVPNAPFLYPLSQGVEKEYSGDKWVNQSKQWVLIWRFEITNSVNVCYFSAVWRATPQVRRNPCECRWYNWPAFERVCKSRKRVIIWVSVYDKNKRWSVVRLEIKHIQLFGAENRSTDKDDSSNLRI